MTLPGVPDLEFVQEIAEAVTQVVAPPIALESRIAAAPEIHEARLDGLPAAPGDHASKITAGLAKRPNLRSSRIPGGLTSVHTPIRISTGQELYGYGHESSRGTILRVDEGEHTVILIEPDDPQGWVRGAAVRGLRFQAGTPRGADAITILARRCIGLDLSELAFDDQNISVKLVDCYETRMPTARFGNARPVSGINVWVDGGNDHEFNTLIADSSTPYPVVKNEAALANGNSGNPYPAGRYQMQFDGNWVQWSGSTVTSRTRYQPFAGFRLTQTEGTVMKFLDMIHQGQGLLIDPDGTMPAGRVYAGEKRAVRWLFLDTCMFDFSAEHNLVVAPRNGGIVQGLHSSLGWVGGAGNHGMLFDPQTGQTHAGIIGGAAFVAQKVYQNGVHGLCILGGSDISFDGATQVTGNSTLAPGVGTGVYVANNVLNFRFDGRSGQIPGWANSQRFGGIIEGPNNPGLVMMGANFLNNLEAGLSNGNTAPQVVQVLA